MISPVRSLTTVLPSAAIQPETTSSFRQAMHRWSVEKDERRQIEPSKEPSQASPASLRQKIWEHVAHIFNSQRGNGAVMSVLQ